MLFSLRLLLHSASTRRHWCLPVLLFSIAGYSGLSHATEADCASELDAAVALASNPDNDQRALASRFAKLEAACPAFAQIAHNRGVIAAADGRWPEAIEHFERALDKDNRAADTHRHLREIFAYRAAQAYARVLDTPLQAQAPALSFQDSSLINSDAAQQYPEHERLRNMATVEYELFAWWQARQSGQDVHDYYVEGYDPEAVRIFQRDSAGIPWQDVKREIAFTRHDAVVVSEAADTRVLLLLRLVGSRWKIYQETRL